MTYTAQYPPSHNSTYVIATTYAVPTSQPHVATDPALSLIGIAGNVSWVSDSGEISNQKFNIDLDEPKIIRRVYLENYHTYGGTVSRGVNNFTVYGTNELTAFQNTVYATTTDLTLLGTFQADAHIETDISDPQYFDLSSNTTAYQYYVFRFADNRGGATYMAIRHLELQTDDGFVVHDPSGGGIGGGEALVHPDHFEMIASGGAIAGGIALKAHGFVGNGGAVIGGSAIVNIGLDFTSSGGSVGGGTGSWNMSRDFTANGGGIAGGAVGIVLVFPTAISGSIGFSGKVEINQWLNSLKGSIGIGGGFNIYQEGSFSASGVLGFGGAINITSPMALSVIGNIGFSGLLNAHQDEILSMQGIIGFGGDINIINQNLLSINGGIGFSSNINILIDDSNLYTLVLHNSTRWT